MWILNATTLVLEQFMSARAVPGGYAILSHTWGPQEPTFDNINSDQAKDLRGYKKIQLTCRQTLLDGYGYVWVDTVCIDKRSSAELSEAINSMFQWYRMAGICYVYLEDVEIGDSANYFYPPAEDPFGHFKEISETDATQFRASRWFTRSWTLQELLAPETVYFYDCEWRFIGDKIRLGRILQDVTRIDYEALTLSSMFASRSVATRMSWAARRQATREEDVAYSLLGLFNVNMPMLYGEGVYKAFRRLQEEIIRGSTDGDHSILAWLTWDERREEGPRNPLLHSLEDGNHGKQGLLAPHVYGFRHAHNIISWSAPQQEDFEISYNGLRVKLLMSQPFEDADTRRSPDKAMFDPELRYAALNCRYENEPWTHIVLRLRRRRTLNSLTAPKGGSVNSADDLWDRAFPVKADKMHFVRMPVRLVSRYTSMVVTLTERPYQWPSPTSCVHVALGEISSNIVGSYPPDAWDKRHSILTLKISGEDDARLGRRRAAIVISASNNQADPNVPKTVALMISVDFSGYMGDALIRPPKVVAITTEAIANIAEISEEFAKSVPPGKPHIIPVNDGSSIRVESELISAADRMIWSLNFSRITQKLANIDPRAITSSQQLNMNSGVPLRFDATETAREAGPSTGRALKLFWRGY